MPHWLTKQASLAPEKIAMETIDGQKITFDTLQKESQIYARKLATLGVEKGMQVAILSPNKLETVYTIYGLSYLGAVAVMLNTRLTSPELQDQLTMAEASFLLVTRELGEEKFLSVSVQKTFDQLNAVDEAAIELATEINLGSPFTMMFTSGTTGTPKAVVHTYGNHWWSAISSVLNLGLDANDKWLLTLPIFHIGGFAILMRSVIYGMTVYFLEKYDRHHVHLAITEKEVTIASLVTLMLRHLIEELGDKALPKTCRTILLGGGSVPDRLLSVIKEKQIPLFQSYGMTETSSQIVSLDASNTHRKLGSSGKTLFSADLKIEQANKDGIGEIYVKGPMVMAGYYKNKLANQQSFSGDWFKTGDLGYLDEDGFLYVVDRRTDLIISGGENIYPSEIENIINKIPGISEVAVVGQTDEKWGQVPVAFIVRDDPGLTAQAINDFLKNELAAYKLPKAIYFLERLPKNASNKILRRKLWEQMEEEG